MAPAAHALERLLEGIPHTLAGNPNQAFLSLCADSRRVQPGDLFFCLRGLRVDGHAFAADALRAGAAGIVTDHDMPDVAAPLQVVVPDTLRALSKVAARFFGFPSGSLTMVGVTGTNGKTTTTFYVESIARAAGLCFGVIGTLGARLGPGAVEELANTTPLAHDLQRLLARFRDEGAQGAVIEVSSHALDLHRVDDVAFDVAVLTNLTQDHLDFHGTFDDYRAAKRKLFSPGLGREGTRPVAVLNLDDPEGAALAGELRAGKGARVLTYGVEKDDAVLNATDLELGASGSRFWVRALRPAPFSTSLPGAFNVRNALAAIAAATALDWDVEAIAEGLEVLASVPGRMTSFAAGEITVYIDYAHTPDGMDQVLRSVRELTRGKLICVFGCGGDRDTSKRPQMGRIAWQWSDKVILTNDNPRHEQPDAIIEDIRRGMAGSARGQSSRVEEVILDRAQAIARAIELAAPGDAVVIAGKGHESYQLFGDERRPFSDARAAQESLERKLACR